MDRPGIIISNKYELLEAAAEGGMAVVWRAVVRGAAGFARPVAVKRILPHLARDKQFLAMFVEEARVGSRLQHPNIVQIEDFGCDEEKNYFIVSEWVEGLDLKRYLDSYTGFGMHTPWALVAAIGIEVLRGLGWAHDHVDAQGNPCQVFHRDITPGNVLIGVNGIAKLTDFGLARAMDRAVMTDPNIIKGKLAYLAPEVAQGAKTTAQSDLYSLGIVLWEAVAGRKLFDGDTDVDVFLGVKDPQVPYLSEIRPEVPEDLCEVISCCLALKPEDRFETAQAVARALALVLRNVSMPTDSDVLGRSVVEARRRLGLGGGRGRAPSSGPLKDASPEGLPAVPPADSSPSPENALLLTQKKS